MYTDAEPFQSQNPASRFSSPLPAKIYRHIPTCQSVETGNFGQRIESFAAGLLLRRDVKIGLSEQLLIRFRSSVEE